MNSDWIAILSGTLLLISEVLPFFAQVDGNGIVHVVANLFRRLPQLLQHEQI
jgi:hypothetical protein